MIKKLVFIIVFMMIASIVSADTFYSWRYREHATDCTGLTDGKLHDLCHETDSDTFFKCEPSAGDCDTAGEWKKLNTTGNAATATALAANGANCSAGSAPLGVDASGAVESCTDFEEDLANMAGLETAVGGANVIQSTEIDTYSELNTIVADVTLTHNGLIDTYSELNTIVADQTLTHNGLIDTYSELNAIVADATLTHNGLIDTFAELDAIVADKALLNKSDSAVITGDYDFGGGGIEIENGITPPACTVGQLFLDTDATSGQQLMGCEAGTFVKQGDGVGAETNSLEVLTTGIATTEIPIGTAADTVVYAALSGDVTMTNGGVVTIGANSVALTTDTTGNYAAGDAEAGNALTGDTATAFFSLGTIEHERGGLEADASAYDGLIWITGGPTYNQTGTTTQIIIFDGAGAPTSAALSGDVTMTNGGVVTVANDSHDHTTTTLSGIDISADTNLAVTAPVVLTNDTISVSAASSTESGVSELAIASELNTGTDTARAVTPDAIAGSVFGEKVVQLVVFDFTVNTVTGDGKFYFVVPSSMAGMNIVSVSAQVYTAGTTNATNIDIARCAVTTTGNACSGTVSDVLSTNMTIDSGENSTADAATPAVIDASFDDITTGQILRIDVDAISTTAAKGLTVTIICRLP